MSKEIIKKSLDKDVTIAFNDGIILCGHLNWNDHGDYISDEEFDLKTTEGIHVTFTEASVRQIVPAC